MVALVNDLAGASQEDIDNLAEYLAGAFPQVKESVQSAQHLPTKARLPTMQFVVKGAIAGLITTAEHPVSRTAKAAPLTREERIDAALVRTETALAGISEAEWKRLAAIDGLTVAEERKAMWIKLVEGFQSEE